ncbi:regulatory alcR [Fusarium beomiforme]|uniref:Regulatory alcR n=1 Tax=Fusarium beomiforme TaxID=44412 RepID=A0A9P5A6X9_9HYPO|nr:regulatory alcR [Fusarium beomiforme]
MSEPKVRRQNHSCDHCRKSKKACDGYIRNEKAADSPDATSPTSGSQIYGGPEPGLKSCSYCIRTKKVCSLNPQWGKTRSRSRVSETGSSITSASNDSSQSKRKRNESPATTAAPSINAKYCDVNAANMLQMLQNSAPGQGLTWKNPFVSTDVSSFFSMDPTLDAQSLAMSFSSPESASQTVAQEFSEEGLPELTKQTSHATTDAFDNATAYSGSQDFDINTLWDMEFTDLNSAPQDILPSTESPANEQNAVQIKRRARLPSNDWSGYPNFSPSPFTSDSIIMQTSNRYLITESLLQIYHDVLENNLACWLAEDNCPYKLQVVTRTTPAPEPNMSTPAGSSRQHPNLPPEWGAAWSNRMYRRVVELDRAAQSARLINLTRSESQAASRVLDLVIMAFTTQWAQGNRRQEKFPMSTGELADDLADALNQEFEESLQQSVWEQAKRALQDVADVESYRVIYAELIFGLTQKPWASDDYQPKSFASKAEKSGKGIKENAMPEIIEIMSQEGPHTYLERATRKIHALKFRFEASESGFTETSRKYAPRRLTEENRRTIGLLYWLAVMFDTVSSSMNERPVALADEDCQHEDAEQILADSIKAAQKGRRGSQRWEMELFIQDDATKPKVGTRWPCSYDDAMQMVSKSAPVKILIYRHLSYLQNALRKRECPQAIEEIIQQTTLLYRYWNMTHGAFFRDLIKHYDTVPPRIRSWFFCIAVPWHLGALMLADVLEFIDKNNLGLEQSRQKRLSSNIAARIRKASAIELADLAQVTTPRLFQEAGINAAQLPDYHFARIYEGVLVSFGHGG